MKNGSYWIMIPGSIWLIASIGAYIFTKRAYVLLSVGAALFFMMTSLYAARHQSDDATEVDRTSASYLSMFPGFGHMYIHRYAAGLFFIGCSLIDILYFSSVLFIETSSVMAVGFSSMIILIALIGYSVIDVDRICTQMNLEGDAAYNLKLKNHRMAFIVWTLFIAVVLAAAMIFSLGR